MINIAFFGKDHHCSCGANLNGKHVIREGLDDSAFRKELERTIGRRYAHTGAVEKLTRADNQIPGNAHETGRCFCGRTALPPPLRRAVNEEAQMLSDLGDGFRFEVGDKLKAICTLSEDDGRLKEDIVLTAYAHGVMLMTHLSFLLSGERDQIRRAQALRTGPNATQAIEALRADLNRYTQVGCKVETRPTGWIISRPDDFEACSGEQQWAIDRKLGQLDSKEVRPLFAYVGWDFTLHILPIAQHGPDDDDEDEVRRPLSAVPPSL